MDREPRLFSALVPLGGLRANAIASPGRSAKDLTPSAARITAPRSRLLERQLNVLLIAFAVAIAFEQELLLGQQCLEEVAFRMGFIDAEQCYRLGEQVAKSGYGKYVMEIARATTDYPGG